MTEFFKRYEKEFFKKFNKYPSIPYSERWNKDLLIGEPDSSKWIRWQPIVQNKVIDWKLLESEIGFKLRDEIKDYFSSYYFFRIESMIENIMLDLKKISSFEEVTKNVIIWANTAKIAFPEKHCFEIGTAKIDGDDGYYIFIDNDTGKVFCQEFDKMNKVDLADSIGHLFEKMKV